MILCSPGLSAEVRALSSTKLTNVCSRRAFLRASAATATCTALATAAAEPASLIASIEKVTLRRGRDGSGPTWFHPRACVVPGADGKTVFMTLQTIAGSDYFGPVHSMTSLDLGKTWTDPQPVPPLGRVKQGNGPAEEGVCDVVPEWHPPTKSVLAFGHNVFYSGPKFSADQPPRWPIYAVWRDGKWGPRRKLEWTDPRGAYIYSNNCGQRVVLPNGDIQMSFTFGATKGEARAVAGVICAFDGETLTVKQVGEPIFNPKGRGLLEPSVTQFQGRFFLTIRAEDSRGYVCVGDDGLKWSAQAGVGVGRRHAAGPLHHAAALAHALGRALPRLYAQGREQRERPALALAAVGRARCACAATPSASSCRSSATA